MSGDVQPRKRKDKKKKKEGSSLGAIHEPVSSVKFKRSESDDPKIFDIPDQGEKIHIQSEHGIGGNICVKVIFFCLFGLLVGAVGLIYMKSLGSTDVDLPTIEESRFAEYFTGWLDDNSDDHEHEALENSLHHDEHDDREGHQDHDDGDEDHEEEHEEEEDQSAEQDSIFKLFGLQETKSDEVDESINEDRVTESESEFTQNVEEDEDDEEKKEEDKEEEQDATEGEEDEEKEQDATEEDEDERNNDKEENGSEGEMKFDEQENEEDDEDEDEDDLSQMDEEEEDLYSASQMEKNLRIQAKNGKVNEKDEDDYNDNDEENEVEEKAVSEEEKNSKDEGEESDEQKNNEEKEETQEGSEEKENSEVRGEDDDLGFEEIEVSEEDLEDMRRSQTQGEGEKEKLLSEVMKNKELGLKIEEEEEEAENEEDPRGVALKLGVGIALIFVAHLVLVKKWKSMNNVPSDENIQTVAETASEKKEVENLEVTFESVISRRQTLVPKDVCLNEVEDEEEFELEEEEEEEEDVGEDEIYEEKIEEMEFKKSNIMKVETVEKPRWNIQGNEKQNEELIDNNEFEEEDEEDGGEEEYEEDDVEEVEEVEEEQEPEDEEEDDNYEEDLDEEEDEVEDDRDDLKNKVPAVVEREETQEKETAPTPPPRTRGGRGAQEALEDSMYFEEVKEVEETSQDGPKTNDDINNNSGPEEPKTPEKKVGNEDEWAFRQELDFADEQFENNPKAAMSTYDKILSKKPTLIRALIGRARTLDHWAEKEKSNAYLKQATDAYKTLLLNHGHRLDNSTYVKLAERCIERMRFSGNFVSAIDVHKALILKYPNTSKYRNTLAVTYLMLNKIPQARVLLNETLTLWPKDGFALVHYGFILKTSDNNMEEAAKKLIAGIQTREEGVIDGMFFFHLGDALNRLGRAKEAMSWYEMGVKEGLFLSKYQRSLYNVNRLKGQPWWTKEETTYQDFFKKLEDNWREIRKEGLVLFNSKGVNLFKEETENLKDTGDWRQLDLYFRGKKQANCNKAPVTCSLVSSFKPAATCTRGQIKFSVMLPNTHVWPHCGPTNCRLRSHLGLVVPKNTFIRVAEETRSWEEGKFIIFDDSFEHEVWHNGTGPRLVLIVDVWHPELTSHERRYLSPI